MITIVIIAILAGIAVPQYLAYTRRAEVAEMVALASIVQKKVGIFYSTKGRWPAVVVRDTEAEVGLENIDGSFGVSSTNDGSCAELCASHG
jgi:Tfp pilus assembly major pilin PilA